MAFQEIKFTDKEIDELVNLYCDGFTDAEVATFFGVRLKGLKNFLRRRTNIHVRDRIEREKIRRISAMRRSLFQKGFGIQYKEGKPRVIENGKVVHEGEAAQAAIPGNLNAQQYWLQNCDSLKEWKNVSQKNLAGNQGQPLFDEISKLSEKELVDYIVDAFKDGLIPKDKLPLTDKPAPKGLSVSDAIEAAFTEE